MADRISVERTECEITSYPRAIYSNRISVIPCIHAEDLGEHFRRAVEGCRKLTHTCIWEIVHVGQPFHRSIPFRFG